MTLRGDIVGCVLAGGKSSRMGSDKALLELDGVPMIARATATLRAVFSAVVIASDRRAEYEFLDAPILPDVLKNCGPLGGIHAALLLTKAEQLFVLATDMPFVSPEVIRHIVANADSHATIPMLEGRVQPLCALYKRSCLPVIERALYEKRFAVHDVLEELNPTFVALTPRLAFYSPNLLDNLNAPRDIERALRCVGRVRRTNNNIHKGYL